MSKNKDSSHRDKGKDEGWEKGQAVCVTAFVSSWESGRQGCLLRIRWWTNWVGVKRVTSFKRQVAEVIRCEKCLKTSHRNGKFLRCPVQDFVGS